MSIYYKTITKFITAYIKCKTKNELNFEYKDKIIYPQNEHKEYLLYIHIPFCKTMCPYCSFHKYIFDEENAKNYFKDLEKEIHLVNKLGFKFHSLYIGGGTPSLMPKELNSMINLIKSFWDIKEISCEADPDVSDEFIELLSNKIDRLSIGIQTFDDKILKQTKRYKKFGSAKEQFDKVKNIIKHFKNVNCDLIFGFPEQTKEQLIYDLETMKRLSPTQISIYPLMHSPSVKKSIEKNMGKVKNNDEFMLYKTILENLKEYTQISSWSFTKDGNNIFDEYVVDYDEYLGLGSGAFGYLNDTLFINSFSLDEYHKTILNDKLSTRRYKQFSKKNMLYYRLMLEFFGFSFNKDKFYKKFNLTNELDFELKLMKFLKITDKENKLTIFGKYIFMVLLKEFYIGMDYVRETSRKNIDKYGKNKL
jgi:coproporphyrinogen III oxidase-like Fe-S oxidoreductase